MTRLRTIAVVAAALAIVRGLQRAERATRAVDHRTSPPRSIPG